MAAAAILDLFDPPCSKTGSIVLGDNTSGFCPSPASAMTQPWTRDLTPTGRVLQLTNPSRCARGRFQAAESQPRRDDPKLWQPTNYDRCYAKVHCKLRRRANSLCPMEIYHTKLIANGESC